MDTGARARPRRISGRLRRFTVRHPVGALLFLVIPIVVAGLVPLLISVMSTHAASLLRAAGIVVLLLSPTLLAGTALHGARAVHAVRRRLAHRRDDNIPQPTNPPIEKLAADLRRLLWQHDRATQSTDAAMSAWSLRALEGAITICATQAARALDVPYPDPPTPDGYIDQPQLRRLLRALAAAGLVLPAAVELLAPDSRL